MSAVTRPATSRSSTESTARRSASGNLLEEGLRFLQVRGLEPLGEPVVALGEDRPGFGMSVLFLVQAGQTHRSAQLQRSGLLLPGDAVGPAKTGLRLVV